MSAATLPHACEMDLLSRLKAWSASGKLSSAIVIILANALTEPLADDLKGVFGTAVWYHPITVWVALVSIVSVNTGSLWAGLALVVTYEVMKRIWKMISPDAPRVARMRRLLSRMRANVELDEEDIQFIDKVTPSTATFVRAPAQMQF